jgi:RHS repeat-associated protein
MGSVTAILDEEGNVLERRSYDAFGAMTCMTPDGTPVAESPTRVDVGFQGQIRDEANGLYQMGYRWYNPALGRWLSRDPIELVAGPNVVVFVGNAPVVFSDPDGLEFYISSDYSAEEKKKILLLLDAISATERGAVIVKKLKKTEKLCVLSRGASINGACHERMGERYDLIYFNPDAVIYIDIKDVKDGHIKKVRASAERILAHELGHALGDMDDGPDKMNNVVKNENPIAEALGQPARVSYLPKTTPPLPIPNPLK